MVWETRRETEAQGQVAGRSEGLTGWGRPRGSERRGHERGFYLLQALRQDASPRTASARQAGALRGGWGERTCPSSRSVSGRRGRKGDAEQDNPTEADQSKRWRGTVSP